MQAAMKKYQEDLRKWRLTVPMDHFKGIRKKFDDAGVKLQAYNYSFNDSYSDEEIDRGFEMAKALEVGFITASSTLSAAKRVAPYADKHKMIVSMHGHSNLTDANEFAKPESSRPWHGQCQSTSTQPSTSGHFFRRGFRSNRLHQRASRSDYQPSSQGSQEGQWSECAVGRGRHADQASAPAFSNRKWNIPR
jgi:hypothetical protein